MEKTVPIPEPPGWPILGNLLDLDFELPLRSLCNLADKHGKLLKGARKTLDIYWNHSSCAKRWTIPYEITWSINPDRIRLSFGKRALWWEEISQNFTGVESTCYTFSFLKFLGNCLSMMHPTRKWGTESMTDYWRQVIYARSPGLTSEDDCSYFRLGLYGGRKLGNRAQGTDASIRSSELFCLVWWHAWYCRSDGVEMGKARKRQADCTDRRLHKVDTWHYCPMLDGFPLQ